MKNKIILFIIAIIVIITLGMLYYPTTIKTPDIKDNIKIKNTIETEKVGNDFDEYGCNLPTGFAYDSNIKACTRSWELDEGKTKAAIIATTYLRDQNLILDRDVYLLNVAIFKCPGCFEMTFSIKNKEDTPLIVNMIDNKVVSAEFKAITY